METMAENKERFNSGRDFKFGLATAGFQIEGGYNGPGEPANNWIEWETLGKVDPSGIAIDFWNNYEQILDLTKATGVTYFRLSIEWTRCWPKPSELDQQAVDRYENILKAILKRGLTPIITLVHFTTPHYYGSNPWLDQGFIDHFVEWTKFAVLRFKSYCNNWVTINEPIIYSSMSYFTGMLPPGEIGKIRHVTSSYQNQLLGHIKAYEAIKDIQPNSTVSFNNFCFSVYELDKAITDIMLAKSRYIKQENLVEYLQSQKKEYYLEIGPASKRDSLFRSSLAKLLNPTTVFKKLIDAVYSSAFESTIDVIQLDFYNPITSSHFRMPGHKTSGGRNWAPGRMLWDDTIDPDLFYKYLKANSDDKVPLWILESGLCNRVKNGRSFKRNDGWDRPRFLNSYFTALKKAVENNLNIEAYFYWTVADNYEWGSYEPRFGIFGVDRERGNKILMQDSMGYDSATKLKSLIDDFRQVYSKT
jgi:beta-glucosidase/6-phospho-beta-glucosidase/beta-galactosidase